METVCKQQADLFSVKLETMEHLYRSAQKEYNDKFDKILDTITLLVAANKSPDTDKFEKRLQSLENENQSVKWKSVN